ncbi:Phage portal protein, SPP1 Gp6-like [Lentzea xinjiangensis]|uniref:Phage portal protein, SPP1 Gp6-like n=1 Tax=Lentzea xinjiangensis TaxID=402600 RepID=A0A1H9TE32_9PSEU|nr:phage portal protein [Lentzea xinjiangensis]SER95411.1 Phage portal protein, SPP1 Gp6-like [Lentzea xinjiangensis]
MLIEPGTMWPPPGHWTLRAYWQSHRAWWSGDLTALRTRTPTTAPGGYWARMAYKPGERQVHVPIAADIARTSADLVAGDTPHIDWEDQQAEPAKPADGEAPAKPKKSPVQEAWDGIAQRIGFANKLLEGVETGSAVGGWYLKPAWDERLGKRPLLTIVAGDQALPTFLFGELLAVTFVTELPAPADWTQRRDSTEVWRWLEHHEPGQIRHELWRGTLTHIGSPQPLADHPTTKQFLPVIDTTPIKPGLLVEFVPNNLPNPLDTTVPLGRSDFQGCETLFDALDEAMASWMRDIELAKARILASEDMLTPTAGRGGILGGLFGKGNTTAAKAFDVDAKVFVPLNMPVEDSDGKPVPIQLIQPEIRFEAHERTVLQLIEQIVSRAGYAPQSFGMHVEGQLSGTAMRRRAEKSYRTRDRKRRYLRPALESIAETLMRLNAVLNPGAPVPDGPPTLVWREADQADPLEMAQVIELLTRARAASREVRVRQAHPDWDDTQVQEEVARLAKEDEELNALSPLLGPTEDDHPEDVPPPKPDEE